MKLFCDLCAPVLAVSLLAVAGQFTFQDNEDETIVVVDQDGRKVKEHVLKIRKADESGITAENGKIIIVNKDGEKQEINVEGAQSIVVNSAVKSIMKDGEEKKMVTGKAIIIGPDGERQEFELSDNDDLPLAKWQFKIFGDDRLNFIPDADGKKMFDLPSSLLVGDASFGKFMIGVNCKPVNSQLRAHLELPEEVGLVVVGKPADESPAQQAGIRMHDILVYADQQELSTVEDLVNAVQLAGNESRELSLTVIRKGKEMGVNVEPMERKKVAKRLNAWIPDHGERDFRIEEFRPGFIFEDDRMSELIERMEKMQEQMDQMFENRFDNLQNQRHSDLEPDDD